MLCHWATSVMFKKYSIKYWTFACPVLSGNFSTGPYSKKNWVVRTNTGLVAILVMNLKSQVVMHRLPLLNDKFHLQYWYDKQWLQPRTLYRCPRRHAWTWRWDWRAMQESSDDWDHQYSCRSTRSNDQTCTHTCCTLLYSIRLRL